MRHDDERDVFDPYLGAMWFIPSALERTIQLRRHVIQKAIVLVDNAHAGGALRVLSMMIT